MTKQEMLEKYADNYKMAQDRIAEAMKKGEKYVLLPKEEFSSNFSWCVTSDTLERLAKDGFKINEVWQPFEYHSIEWYD